MGEVAESVFSNDLAVFPNEPAENVAYNINFALDAQIENIIERNGQLWECKVCSKTSNRKGHMKEHAETHIEGSSQICHICNNTLSTRNSLRLHIANTHSQIMFSCSYCGKSDMNKNVYRSHKKVCVVAKYSE